MATPAERGFRLPAATAAHERTVMAWPTMRRIDFWRGHLGAARDAFAATARLIAEREPVLVVADEGEGRAAAGWLGDGIEVVELALDDSWIRDTGPVVVVDEAGERLAVHLGFNGWGERLAPWDRDAELASPLAAHLGLPVERAPFVLEGGAFVGNGRGTIVVSESCVLDERRNPGLARSPAEDLLRAWLGVERVVWIAGGLADDRAGGHIDDVVAFTDDPDRVLLQTTTDTDDPDHAAAADARRRLEEAGLDVVEIDVLPHVECFDEIVEVPYVGFYVGDGSTRPRRRRRRRRRMLDLIGAQFPGRETVPVPATVLAYGGGGVHAITTSVPAGR
ncbi:MAG: agmatine deiminase family protein [Acidimicrobiales bacterium]